MEKLTAIVAFILALCIASERLVEIIKGLIPKLDKETPDEKAEGRRRAYLQILSVTSGIVTALLARDYIPKEIADSLSSGTVFGLGLLASGGAGFWNSILSYVTKVKELKSLDVSERKPNAQSPSLGATAKGS